MILIRSVDPPPHPHHRLLQIQGLIVSPKLVVRDGHVIVHGMHLPLAHHTFESVHRDRQGWAIVTDDDPCTLTLLYALTIEEMEFVLMKLRDAA